MAKQLEGVYEKVYECAKKEFLEKGFKDASLRVIAREAGTSTGSIYTRFQNKEGLFHAIVSPVVEELKTWFVEVQENFHQKPSVAQKKDMLKDSAVGTEQMVEYIYEHFSEFKLLLECSEGTEFSDFLNELVEIEVDYTYKFMECTGYDVTLSNEKVDREFLHIVNSAYYSGIFEIVRHNMKKQDGIQYARQLREFYYAGFEKLYDWVKPERQL